MERHNAPAKLLRVAILLLVPGCLYERLDNPSSGSGGEAGQSTASAGRDGTAITNTGGRSSHAVQTFGGTVTSSGGTSNGGTTATYGNTSSGGTLANSGGSGTGSPSTGGSPSGGTTGSATTVAIPQVHGAVQSLGSGNYRITYDFSNPDQLLDWEIVPSSNTAPLTLSNGELVVAHGDLTTQGSLALVRFKWSLRVDQLKARSSVTQAIPNASPHTNFYLATLFQGSWAPTTGYGCIFNGNRFFSMDEDQIVGHSSSTFSNNPGEPFSHTITMSATALTWTTKPADVLDPRGPSALSSVVTAFYQGSLRYLLMGGYESSNRFDDIVIDGAFGPF